MTRRFVIPSMFLLATITSGCATGPRSNATIQTISNAQITVTRAEAHLAPGGFVVDGDVRRADGNAGPAPGHLRVTGRNAAGEIIAATETGWGEFKTRRSRLAYFQAFLSTANAFGIAAITVEPVREPTP